MNGAIFTPRFLTATVEWVESFTVVLAIRLTIGAVLEAFAAPVAALIGTRWLARPGS